MNPWEILGIDPNASRRDVKRAYARLIKECRPEEDPERFETIRGAYERATNIAKARERRGEAASGESVDVAPDETAGGPSDANEETAADAAKTDETDGGFDDALVNVTLRLDQDGASIIAADTEDHNPEGELEREVAEVVARLQNSDNVEEEFAKVIAERPVDLRWSEVFERELFGIDVDNNELLFALASREFRWSESRRFDSDFLECLYALEVGLKVRDELRIKAEQAPGEHYRAAAKIMLREAPPRWEYETELNNLGLQFYGTYGEYWNRLIYSEPLDEEPDDWSSSSGSSFEALGCFGMLAVVAVIKVAFRAAIEFVRSLEQGDVSPTPVLVAILVVASIALAAHARMEAPTYR